MLRLEVDIKGVQDNVNRMLKKKVKTIYYDRVMDEIAYLLKDTMEPYVPMKSGQLRGNAYVDNGNIIYTAKAERRGGRYDYAAYQYMNEFPKRFTPGTFGHWDKHLTAADKQYFYEQVKDLIVEEMNDA